MSSVRRRHNPRTYRSGLEDSIAAELARKGYVDIYETHVIRYEKPLQKARYTPDFVLPNGIVIETKGQFTTADRQKHKHIKAQHPHLDIRFVFSNSKNRISKKSKTTYAMWCEQYGFLYADKHVPAAWLEEPLIRKRKEAIDAFDRNSGGGKKDN